VPHAERYFNLHQRVPLPLLPFLPLLTPSLYNSLPVGSLFTISTVPLKRLRLPKSNEEWAEADQLLSAVVLLVLQATTAEEKNAHLCKGIYDVLANRFGTQPSPGPQGQQQRRIKQHDRAFKKVTQLKNQAQQALHKAKRQGESATIIKSLTASLVDSKRSHRRDLTIVKL